MESGWDTPAGLFANALIVYGGAATGVACAEAETDPVSVPSNRAPPMSTVVGTALCLFFFIVVSSGRCGGRGLQCRTQLLHFGEKQITINNGGISDSSFQPRKRRLRDSRSA